MLACIHEVMIHIETIYSGSLYFVEIKNLESIIFRGKLEVFIFSCLKCKY